MSVFVFIPGALLNPLNRRRHWRLVQRSAKDWRARTSTHLLLEARQPGSRERALFLYPKTPKRVTLLARVGAEWDEDNLFAALKPVVDGIRDAGLIHDDKKSSGHVITRDQVTDRARRGVEITVEML